MRVRAIVKHNVNIHVSKRSQNMHVAKVVGKSFSQTYADNVLKNEDGTPLLTEDGQPFLVQ